MKLDKRRRREFKTNYHKRLILLKGKSPRLVIRKTNNYLVLQIIESIHAQDKTIFIVTTKDLLELGWPKEKAGSLKSTTASYLAGYLIGKRSLSKIKDRVIVDTGLSPSTKGSRIYAAIKGAADAGIKINIDEKIIPSKERIEGKNNKLETIFNKVKGAIK